MSIRKMYVVPSEIFDSYMRKLKITEDPLLTFQANLEQQKEKILEERNTNSDKKLLQYTDLVHRGEVFKQNETPGQDKKITPNTSFLERFYDYEPREVRKRSVKRKRGTHLLRELEMTEPVATPSPRRLRRKK